MVPGYTTGRLLGFGGSGEVWSAVQDSSGRAVALKVLAVPDGDRARVLRECMLLRRIDHQHVVRLHGVVDLADDGVVLVLERAPGGSLAALVAARGALDAGEVVTVLSPLATALADLHARGLVHGDVSPGNVLFAADGRPLLSDLGVASVVGLESAWQRHGTPGYIDPAMLAGGAPAPSTDVFGLCAVGWYALTGRPPQPSGSRPPLIPLAPDTPAELAALVEKGLDPQPARRPGAAQLALKVFDAAPAAPVRLVPTDPAAAAAEVVTHRLRLETSPATPAEPPRSRRRVALIGLAAGLLALGGAGAVVGVLGTWGQDAPAASLDAEREPVDPGTAEPGAEEQGAEEPGTAADTAGTPAGTPTGSPTSSPAGTPDGAPGQVPADALQALSAQDPLAAVPALAALRAMAYAAGDAAPLQAANAPGSQSMQADLAVLDALTAEGLLLEGLTFDVRRAELVSLADDTAVVEVDVVTGEHRRVRAVDGAVVDAQPASGSVTSRLTLVRLDEHWAVSAVS